MRHPSPSRPGLHRFVAVALAAWLVMTALPVTAGAQVAEPPLDIAAILLTPTDLQAAGQPDFVFDNAIAYTTLDGAMAAERYSWSHGSIKLADHPGTADLLRDSGWQRMQETYLGHVPDGDLTRFDGAFSSGIEAYATPEGASKAYEALAQIDSIRDMVYGNAAPAGTGATLGDESSTWRIEEAGEGGGPPVVALTRWVRIDRYVVTTTLIDFEGRNPPDAAWLDQVTIVLLDRLTAAESMTSSACGAGALGDPVIAILMGRVDAIPAKPGLPLPGLSTCVQRLDEISTLPHDSQYDVLNGVALRHAFESADDHAANQATTTANGLVDSYVSQQRVKSSSQAMPDTFLRVTTWIDLYADEAAATAHLDSTEQRLRGDDGITLDSFAPGPASAGDDAIAYVFTDTDTGSSSTTISARTGNRIVSIRIDNATGPLLEPVQALFDAQLACIAAGGCPQPIPVPPALM